MKLTNHSGLPNYKADSKTLHQYTDFLEKQFSMDQWT